MGQIITCARLLLDSDPHGSLELNESYHIKDKPGC